MRKCRNRTTRRGDSQKPCQKLARRSHLMGLYLGCLSEVARHKGFDEPSARFFLPAGLPPHWRSHLALWLSSRVPSMSSSSFSFCLHKTEQHGRLLKQRHRSRKRRRRKDSRPDTEVVRDETRDGPRRVQGLPQYPAGNPKRPFPNCHSKTPRSRGVGILRVTEPLTASLRGLWIRGNPSPGNDGRNEKVTTRPRCGAT